MNVFSISARIIVTCSNRLSPYLQQEIEALGMQPLRVFKTGVELKGTMEDCIRLNLHLRCASQVLFSLMEFAAPDAAALYTRLTSFKWEDILSPAGYFSITSNVNNDTINNALYANVRVKDAIVDRFRRLTGKRPDSGSSLDQAVVHLYWQETRAEIFIDSSGETLSKHGYRRIPGKAPMLEALAAATLLATRWDRQSPFVNPMCGSATLAIEAALLATRRMPGLFRSNYGFMHLVGYDAAFYERERRQLDALIEEVPGLQVVATDISPDAVNISKINAGAAGVASLIDFSICDFRDTAIPQPPGVVYFNPEYGERLGDEAQLQTIYAAMGDFLKQQCKGYTGYIFTGNLELAKKIGLKPKRRIEFFTGKIDCRLLEYELYAGTRRTDAPPGAQE